MAAGRQNNNSFSRKRYSNESETRVYRNPSDYTRNGFEQSRFKHQSDQLQGRNREDAVLSKKRKFSPVVWDHVDKQVKISKDFRKFNEIVTDVEIQVSSAESTLTNVSDGSPNEDGEYVVEPNLSKSKWAENEDGEYVVEPNLSKSKWAENEDGEYVVEPNLSKSKWAENEDGEYVVEPNLSKSKWAENEDGEYVVEPNLSKSKWAFHDSPRGELDGNGSSPESGEFKRDGSEGKAVSSLSDVEGEKYESGDGKVGGSDGVDYSGLDSDSDCEESLSVAFGVGPSCRNVFEFERLRKISEGTYGVVHQARDKKTGEIVALKKIKMGKEEGFPLTALREIKLLGELRHPYVVGLKEVVMDEFDGVYMVMEYIDHELKSYMERMDESFGQSEVKGLMYQLLKGLSYLHDNYVIHRDLKTSNLLLTNEGELKICDFGMARHYAEPIKPYTSLVVTLWYRAPELLLGMKHYTTAVDMWSVGCIMAELLSKKPLFDGSKELEQINKIFSMLGTPDDSRWPGYSKLPGLKSKPKLVKQPYNNLRKKFPVAMFMGSPSLTELGFDLLSRLLTYDPAKRITAKEALKHKWFQESPHPAEHVTICK